MNSSLEGISSVAKSRNKKRRIVIWFLLQLRRIVREPTVAIAVITGLFTIAGILLSFAKGWVEDQIQSRRFLHEARLDMYDRLDPDKHSVEARNLILAVLSVDTSDEYGLRNFAIALSNKKFQELVDERNDLQKQLSALDSFKNALQSENEKLVKKRESAEVRERNMNQVFDEYSRSQIRMTSENQYCDSVLTRCKLEYELEKESSKDYNEQLISCINESAEVRRKHDLLLGINHELVNDTTRLGNAIRELSYKVSALQQALITATNLSKRDSSEKTPKQ